MAASKCVSLKAKNGVGQFAPRRPRPPPRASNPFYGIPAISSFPFGGSALVVWDSGSPPPPTTNTPPTEGADPHSHPRSDVKARLQKSEFLKVGGQVVDVCGATPCYANGYTGNGGP